MKPAEIAKALKKTSAGVRSRLCRLAQAGAVVRLPEGYMLADATGEDPALSWLDGDTPRQRPANEHIYDRGLLGNGGKRCPGNELGNVLGNEEATEEGNEGGSVYSPETVFSEGFADVFGGPPDAALVRREARRFLAERGLYGVGEVNAKLAGELYLAGQKLAEVELGKRLDREDRPLNVRERIHRFCQDAQAYLENRPRPEENPFLPAVIEPVQTRLDAMVAAQIAQVLDPPEDPAEAALAAFCKITLTQMASAIEANKQTIKKFLDPDPDPTSPLVAFADMLLRQKLAEFLAREIADMLPAGEENREKAPEPALVPEYLPERGPDPAEGPERLLSALLDQAGERLRGSLWPWGNPSRGGL